MQSLTSDFIDTLSEQAANGLSLTVEEQVYRSLIDYLGVTLAGAKMSGEKGIRLLAGMDGGKGGEAGVIGYGRRANLSTAALLNGFSSHLAELDDGVRFCSVHAGGPLFSALLPIVEQRRMSRAAFARGVLVGYEAAIRLGMAIQPAHRNRGFHATGTCGTVGAAMGVATALGYARPEMLATLAAALTSASGMLAMMQGRSELKPFNSGQAAAAGLTAAMVGGAGFCGPEEVLDGPRGFLAMMAPEAKPVQLVARNNEPAITLVYQKPYAACRHCHPAIEAALKLRELHRLTADDIESVMVHTYRLAAGGHDHTDINGVTSAKMSTPYAVAACLSTGRAGLAEFSDARIVDPVILALTKKVKVTLSEELDNQVPRKRPAIIEIRTTDGNRFVERVDIPRGEPETPLSAEALDTKFCDLAEFGGLTPANSAALLSTIKTPERDLTAMFTLLFNT